MPQVSGRVGCMGNGWGSSPGWNGASLSMTNDEVATDHGRDVRRGALQVVQGTRQRYYDCGDRDYPGAQHVLTNPPWSACPAPRALLRRRGARLCSQHLQLQKVVSLPSHRDNRLSQ